MLTKVYDSFYYLFVIFQSSENSWNEKKASFLGQPEPSALEIAAEQMRMISISEKSKCYLVSNRINAHSILANR